MKEGEQGFARFVSALQPNAILALYQRAGVGPMTGGFVLCGAWITLLLLAELISGRLFAERGPEEWQTFVLELSVALMLGTLFLFVVSAIAAHAARTQQTLKGLHALEEISDRAVDRFGAEIGTLSARHLIPNILIGVAAGVLAPFYEFPVVGAYAAFDPTQWAPEVYIHRTVGPLLGAGFIILLDLIVFDSIRFWRLSRQMKRIELTDLGRYEPLTSQGLSNAIIIMGFVSLFAFLAVEERYVLLVGTVIAYGSGGALIGLLLPVWALRGLIKSEKEKELKWCRARIPAARDALRNGKSGAGEELSGLLAYHDKVESITAWPIAPGGVTRFAFFLLIPLGSWAGGALVERLIDTALD